eukprot:CAMPEP_0168414362 /NCGR_PEP_ID=MMETSP0228-20121227/29686_1 /TAXON_ID=133427 /ORGANISM="Protoceratium reticulatum, Strain CCCM 535 (=CCMP 1889)" /LENGTH=229 /DNA_ID=CAMNT_0008428155 /DNA_START=18 /DNA_END=708 /DNA_ORIENTATION=-
MGGKMVCCVPQRDMTGTDLRALEDSDMSSDSETRRSDRSRLKWMMQAFLSGAMKGMPAGIVDAKTGRIQEGEYLIDQCIRNFILRPKPPRVGSATATEKKVSLSRIIDVFRHHDLPPGLRFPGQKKLGALGPERLVVLQYANASRGVAAVFPLLEGDASACDTFVTCLGMLKIYAEAQQRFGAGARAAAQAAVSGTFELSGARSRGVRAWRLSGAGGTGTAVVRVGQMD